MSHPAFAHRQPLASRLLAVALALLVLGLGILTVAPTAHGHLHDDADQADHTCAIVLFAQGITTAAAFLLVAAPLRWLTALRSVLPADPIAAAVRLLPPACGPPAV